MPFVHVDVWLVVAAESDRCCKPQFHIRRNRTTVNPQNSRCHVRCTLKHDMRKSRRVNQCVRDVESVHPDLIGRVDLNEPTAAVRTAHRLCCKRDRCGCAGCTLARVGCQAGRVEDQTSESGTYGTG